MLAFWLLETYILSTMIRGFKLNITKTASKITGHDFLIEIPGLVSFLGIAGFFSFALHSVSFHNSLLLQSDEMCMAYNPSIVTDVTSVLTQVSHSLGKQNSSPWLSFLDFGVTQVYSAPFVELKNIWLLLKDKCFLLKNLFTREKYSKYTSKNDN